MKVTKNVYVCNVSSSEAPLEMPSMNFIDKTTVEEHHKKVHSEMKKDTKEETPLEMSPMKFERDGQ